MRLLIAVVLVMCSACGIKSSSGDGAGGDDTKNIPPGCPTAGPDDVWIDARLDCFTEGQAFIDISKSATGEPADTAYILVEHALDDSFTNINAGKSRYFEYMLCVKGAPSSISTLSLATDFAVANGLGNFGWALPDGIATATMSISGNPDTDPYMVRTSCDRDQHPVIVDFATGTIESLNRGALANLKVTNH